ncbi:unnamed protein product [Fraxinus pennsylvanica]|uniref:Uncharacterized protein n=1 Tax=Fraxinus pennsylvanica TaxID=56036 RepID=A0AAD2DNF4_9LAMI|nr:unnamed protein product [Fraxinus pennsylvanica]
MSSKRVDSNFTPSGGAEGEDEKKFLKEKEGSKIPRGNVVIQYPELTEVEQNRHFSNKDATSDGHKSSIGSYLKSDTGKLPADVWIREGKFTTETQYVESENLTDGNIFEYIRKKARNFLEFDNSKPIDSNLVTLDCESWHENGSESGSSYLYGWDYANPNRFVQDVVIIDGETNDTSRNTIFKERDANSKDYFTDLELKTTQVPSHSTILGSFVESSVKKLSSPSLLKGHSCSLATEGEIKKENSFVGFQSIFSFL